MAESPRDAAGRAFAFTVTVLLGLMLLTALPQISTIGDVPLLRRQVDTLTTAWPQSWSFFDNAADVAQVSVFRVGDAGYPMREALVLNFSARNAFGLDRTSQASFEQLDYLAQHVPIRDRRACADVADTKCVAAATRVSVANLFRPQLLCGDLIIVWSHARPFSSRRGAVYGSGQVARVSIACSR